MSWTVSNLQRPLREDFSLEISGIIAEKESQIYGRRFVGFDGPKKAAPFFNFKGAGGYDRYGSRPAAQSRRTGWRLPHPR